MENLKIKPEFRDLIPKLTDEEFAQLEANILEAGVVKEPIIVWNGYIVDGHHRWYIIEKHPEIPYKVEEKEFKNEYAAMAWACRNQLGRRNLSNGDRDYLIGKRQENEHLASRENRDAKTGRFSRKYQSDTYGDSYEDTASKIAEEHGVGRMTVFRDEQFAKGVDIADEIIPGMKEDILHGNIQVPKKVVRKISKADPEAQKEAVKLISEGEANKAEVVLSGITGLYDTGQDLEFTEADLMEELAANFYSAMKSLKTTRESHKDLMGETETNNRIINNLIALHEAAIADLQEEKL